LGGRPKTFKPIPDRFRTIDQVQAAVREAGLESSNLVLAVDFTKSNTWTGERTFGRRCLHDISGPVNPYAQVIDVMGRTLEAFDDDKLIPAYGFGDETTGDKYCFPFTPDNKPSHGVAQTLKRYEELAGAVATGGLNLAGPTSFEAVIREAIQIVHEERGYHILVIIADGQISDARPNGPTARAIIEASNYPLSIVTIGVGDGPWDAMEEYDDALPTRVFDNFQFVALNDIVKKAGGQQAINSSPDARQRFEALFALHALMEVPDQYIAIKELGLFGAVDGHPPETSGRLASYPLSAAAVARRVPPPPPGGPAHAAYGNSTRADASAPKHEPDGEAPPSYEEVTSPVNHTRLA